MSNSLTWFVAPKYELKSDFIPEEIKSFFKKDKWFLKHQIDTYLANKDNHVTINTYATGTGKTQASLLHLLDIPNKNTLFIAPTNELISQHVRDIEKFVGDTKLSHRVIEINAKILQNLFKNSDEIRKSELLYNLLVNPDNVLTTNKSDYGRPYIMVTNPDIFYYAITFNYNTNDKRNIFQAFLSVFDYFIIDEFHYYDAKQLCTFLFFMSVYLAFGQFDAGKRITILTATPSFDVIQYFERMAIQNLKYTILSPIHVESNNINSEKALSTLKLTFYSYQKDIKKTIEENINFITENYKKKDGAIIFNSLDDINVISRYLYSHDMKDFGLITGLNNKYERTDAITKSLILATPTVDIGYNFEKVKDRQNIDYLIFDFRYSDQFLQRIGRAGRILGKLQQNISSEALVFVTDEQLNNLATHFGHNSNVSRMELEKLSNNIFPPRENFNYYINYLGLSEFAVPLEELNKMFAKSDKHFVTEDLFEIIYKILRNDDIGKKTYYSFIKPYSNKYYALFDVKKNFKKSKDFENCNNKSLKRLAGDFYDTLNIKDIDHSFIDTKQDPIEEIKSYINENSKEFIKYVDEQFYLIKGFYNFRGSYENIPVYIYDPQKIINTKSKLMVYDLFHLLKNYEVEFFESKDNIKNLLENENCFEDENILFSCTIKNRLEKKRNITYRYKVNEKDLFEKKYINNLTTISNIEFQIKEEGSDISLSGTLELNKKIMKAFKDKFLPCIIFDEKYSIYHHSRKQNIYPKELNIYGDYEKTYKVVFGRNAYFLSPKVERFKIILDKKAKYYCC